MKCKYCQAKVFNPDGTEPTGRAKGRLTIKHYHVAHPEMMVANLVKGRQVLKEKREEQADAIKAIKQGGKVAVIQAIVEDFKKGEVEQEKEGKPGKKKVGHPPTIPTLVGFNAPKPGAVMFNIGSSSLEIEPISLFEAYILYLDMKAKCGLTDSFSTCIVDSISIAWKMMVPQVPKLKTDSDNGHKIGIAIG